MPAVLRVHLGHHFFGAGNLGDDLMLAGFLAAAAESGWLAGARLCCPIPHDRASQARRFPQIEWLPCDEATRADSIARCNVWLGLGDTPFQTSVGTWMLDHLREEAAWCERSRKPMFYLCVGVNDASDADHPATRFLVGRAVKIWTRDPNSAALLRPVAGPGKVTAGADLAHLWLAGRDFPRPAPGALGLVLNFEDPAQYRVDDFSRLLAAWPAGAPVAWLAQEVRALDGSELTLHAALPPADRIRAPLVVPDYAGAGSAEALLAPWNTPEFLLTSRYHATLIGAWMGCRTVSFGRAEKVRSAGFQFGVPLVESLADTAGLIGALTAAAPVAAPALRGAADLARACCEAFFDATHSLAPRAAAPEFCLPPERQVVFSPRFVSPSAAPLRMVTSPTRVTPTRVLFLRPDTYGDLVLFEPVLRRLRAVWGEQTEIGVLIREPFLDFAPLVAVPGVRWLTIGANPYRDPVDGSAASAALSELRGILGETFRPDCLVAPCSGKSWLEAAAGMLLPGVRQVGLGRFDPDPAVLDATALALGFPPGTPVPALFAEVVDPDPAAPEWRQQAAVADHLLGGATTDAGDPDGEDRPRLVVPPDARAAAGAVLAAAGLTSGGYVVCAAAGVANVRIKAWPPERFGEILAWLGREHGVPALLVGHEREAERLEAVQRAARAIGGGGPEPAIWLGRDGEMPVLAALIGSARLYLGNDTGAIHLAAALDCPLVGVYGGGAGLRFRPAARARSWTVVQPLPCFGCAWECFFGDAPCVGTIAPESVRGALERLLAAERDGGAPPPEIIEVGGLAPAAREVVERVAPRFHAARSESASRYRQIRELDALARRREREREEDRAAAGAEGVKLHAHLARAETDAAARLQQVEELTAGLFRSEAAAAARLQQVEELTGRLTESEADRDARAGQIAELTAGLRESEAERLERGRQIEELTGWLRQTEIDRTERGRQVEELTAWLKESEADRDARGEQLRALAAGSTNPPGTGTP